MNLSFLFHFSGKVIQFTVLCEQYQPSLCRDPVYKEYLDRIGQLFFNLPPPRPQPSSAGIFGNLLQGFLGNTLGDDDSDEETTSTVRQSVASEDLD